MVKARNAILASLPLPDEVPDDTLSPLSIPSTFTLPEFLSSLSGVILRSFNSFLIDYTYAYSHSKPRK